MKINCDLGEGLDEVDALLIPLVDQASIACGGHAGDEASISRCLRLAKQYNTEVGIHPSYPDSENFGRKSLNITPEVLSQSLRAQIQLFLDICGRENISPSYVKAHGALYNDLARDPHLLKLFLELVTVINHDVEQAKPLAVMVNASLRNTSTVALAKQANVSLLYEAFADRAYCDDGSLLTRSDANAVYTEPAKIVAQYHSLANKQGVNTVSGNWLALHADTVCVHGDNPAIAQAVMEIKKLT